MRAMLLQRREDGGARFGAPAESITVTDGMDDERWKMMHEIETGQIVSDETKLS